MIALLLAALAAGSASADARFLALLRGYAERGPVDTIEEVSSLVEAQRFPERDHAEFWLGSVLLSLGDAKGARAWIARLAAEYPSSPYAERGGLLLGEASLRERRYGDAAARFASAALARDAAVSEGGRLGLARARSLLVQQRAARASGLFVAAVALWLLAPVLRKRPPLWPLPAELRVAGPVLLVLALFSLRQQPAARAAVLAVAGIGALLVAMGGLRLRAISSALPGRAAQAALGVAALGAAAYAVLERTDLLGGLGGPLR